MKHDYDLNYNLGLKYYNILIMYNNTYLVYF